MDGEELDKLHYMEKFLKKHPKDHGSTYGFKQRVAKKTMLKPKKGFPKIRGRASDVQSLDHALLALFSAHMLEDNLQHRQIRLFLDLNLQFPKLSPGSQGWLSRAIVAALRRYAESLATDIGCLLVALPRRPVEILYQGLPRLLAVSVAGVAVGLNDPVQVLLPHILGL